MWAILGEDSAWNWCFETERPDGETGLWVFIENMNDQKKSR